MTPDDVKQRVAKIDSNKEDDEAAHSMEDDLYLDLLTLIASGQCEDPNGCAAEAIKSQDLEFCRWCA